MRFAIAKEHRDYYEKNGYIEFDSLLTPGQLISLKEGVQETLTARAMVPALRLRRQLPDVRFAVGHDIWRTDDNVRKIVLLPGLAEIAADLFRKRPLRIAYDRFLPSSEGRTFVGKQEESYTNLLGLHASLEEVSALQGVVGGIIVCLKPRDGAEDSLFSSVEGHAVFVNPAHPIDFSALNAPAGEYLLIVYGQKKTVYIKNEQDPHVDHLKDSGYNFGDLLTDNLNPYVVR